jgi:2-amino-4-hydroxy-6-hydroxymethyldihydropteridine diphosphokinase
MLDRAFVLIPLYELAPDFSVGGISLSERLTQIDSTGIERLPSGNGWWKDEGAG